MEERERGKWAGEEKGFGAGTQGKAGCGRLVNSREGQREGRRNGRTRGWRDGAISGEVMKVWDQAKINIGWSRRTAEEYTLHSRTHAHTHTRMYNYMHKHMDSRT